MTKTLETIKELTETLSVDTNKFYEGNKCFTTGFEKRNFGRKK